MLNHQRIQLLDATLRDGGLGLEDEFINHFNDAVFTQEMIRHIAGLLVDSGVDIVELGSIHPLGDDHSMFSKFHYLEQLSEIIPSPRTTNQMYVGMYVGPDTPDDRVVAHNESLLDGARVILRYSQLQKSLDFCEMLVEKGYKVFIQPMLTMRYSEKELQLIVDTANRINAYALYFVDSYGYMMEENVKYFFQFYDSSLKPDIKIGFHAHNNMNLAFANVLTFLSIPSEREIIVDSCATGMGQGAGNLQTELILPYLNQHFGKRYNFDPILQICELLDETYDNRTTWGYSVFRALPAIYRTAYKYAVVLRKKHKLSYCQINEILRQMPDQLRPQYTPDNLEKVYDAYLKQKNKA